MAGLVAFLIVAVICATILSGMYIYYCAENEVRMFENPRYRERIEKLEKQVKELMKE